MVDSGPRMPIVFVIAEDWKLRTGVRAELRERGIAALGMETADYAGRALASDEIPAVVVLDANAKAATEPAIQELIERVPTILVASRTEAAPQFRGAKIFYRPVRISEIVEAVMQFLGQRKT